MKLKLFVTISTLFSLFFICFVIKTSSEYSHASLRILNSKNVKDVTKLITTKINLSSTDAGLPRWEVEDFDDSDWMPIKIPSFQIVKLRQFKEGNYVYYRIKVPRSAFSSLEHLKNETSLFLQSVFYRKFDVIINGRFYRTFNPIKPGENILILPLDDSIDNVIAIKARIHEGDTGIDSREKIILGKGLELNEAYVAGFKGQSAFQLIFILCKGSILFIFALISFLLKTDRSFSKFFIFGMCAFVEELVAGDYLSELLNFNEMVYLYTCANIGGALALFLFFADIVGFKFSRKVFGFFSLLLTGVMTALAIDSLYFNYIVNLSELMKTWNLVFIGIQVYYLAGIFKLDKLLFFGLLVTIFLSSWSVFFSTNIGLNFKAYGNLLLFYIVAFQTFVLFKRDQQELQSKEKLLLEQETDVAIGKTASMFAHDVRKPFDQLKLIIETFEYGNVDKDFLKTAMSEVNVSILNVEQQIHEIINFSKLSSLNLKEISFYKNLSSAIKQVMSLHQEMDIDLEYNLTAYSNVLGEESRLTGILVNLLSNAVEAIRDLGGRFTGKIKITTLVTDNYFIFKIFNDGPEIPEEFLDDIFKPLFSRGKSSGTGLGLASVAKSVSLHKGHIEVENQLGEGVQFKLFLQNGEQIDLPENYTFHKKSFSYSYLDIDSTLNVQSHSYTFLVLENNNSNKDKFRRLFDKLPFKCEVRFFTNKLDTVEYIKKRRFDLYFLNSQDGGKEISDIHLNHLSIEKIVYSEPPNSLADIYFSYLRNIKKIMYVDDTRIFRVAWQMFHGEGNITCLSSPEEALAEISRNGNAYEVFILDYYFSNSSLNGLYLGRKIKELLPNAIILVSSNIEQSESEFLTIRKDNYDVRRFLNKM